MFEYYAPTKVLFGKHQEEQVGALLRKEGAHHVLIHYGGDSAKKSGLLDRVCDAVTAAGLSYVLFGGVQANPILSKVEEGIVRCKQEGIDFILAVGGGSVIDSSKAIAYGVVNEGNLWEYYEKKKTVTGSLGVGCILTIAAAGSEMSNSAVITNDAGRKCGLTSEYGYCKFAIMNPELTYSVSKYQSMSGAVDIMMHTLERFFHKEAPMELYDHIAIAVLQTVLHHAPIVKEDPTNYESRAELMWASSVSHNGMSGPRVPGDWACHQLEHELSGTYDVAHGAGLSAIWGSWARYVVEEDVTRFELLAKALFGFDTDHAKETAMLGIEAMEAFFHRLDMPITLPELGVTLDEQALEQLALQCSYQKKRTIGCVKTLDYEDMLQIYKNANNERIYRK